MKKIFIIVAALFIVVASSFAQEKTLGLVIVDSAPGKFKQMLTFNVNSTAKASGYKVTVLGSKDITADVSKKYTKVIIAVYAADMEKDAATINAAKAKNANVLLLVVAPGDKNVIADTKYGVDAVTSASKKQMIYPVYMEKIAPFIK